MKSFYLILFFFVACSIFKTQRPDVVPIEVNTHLSREHYVSPQKIAQFKKGMAEEEVYKITSDIVHSRMTYSPILPMYIMPGKYIPVEKIIRFIGGENIRVTETSYGKLYENKGGSLQLTLYFYRDRLLDYSVSRFYFGKDGQVKLPPTTEDEYLKKNNYTVEAYKKYYEDYVLKFREKGGHSWVDKNAIIYWEAPDFEEKLRKSGYYEFKAKLDKDFEEKKGYWAPKECLLFDKYFCD